MLVQTSVLGHAGKMVLKQKWQVRPGVSNLPQKCTCFTLKSMRLEFFLGPLERRQEGGRRILLE